MRRASPSTVPLEQALASLERRHVGLGVCGFGVLLMTLESQLALCSCETVGLPYLSV